MLRKPRFKNHLRVETVESDGVYLISEVQIRLLEGPVFRQVVPLIDGCREADQIVEELENSLSPAEVYYVLLKLERDGFLSEGCSLTAATPSLAFWDLLGVESSQSGLKLQDCRVSVEALSGLPTGAFEKALQELEFERALPDQSDLRIVLTPEYLAGELAAIDQAARQAGQDWLPVKPTGAELWIGPIFRADRPGCWHCLAHPLRMNRPASALIQQRSRSGQQWAGGAPATFLETTLQLAARLAVLEIARLSLDSDSSDLPRNLIVFDLLRLASGWHRFRPRPQCSHCGDPSRAASPEPWRPQSCLKAFTSDGGHRTRTPAETYADYHHIISPLTGVIKELEGIGPRIPGVAPVYYGRTGSPGLDTTVQRVKMGLRTGSSGKGKDDATSRSSALCEAIERYSGVYQGDEPSREARFLDLQGEAIHPHDCLLFSQSQYERRQQINASAKDSFNCIPSPFREDEKILWSGLWSLTKDCVRYLPTAYCYFDFPSGKGPFCWADSNGCAAGNTKEEAFLQAFMELVERDAVAIWWYNRLRRPELDLDSVDSDWLSRIRTGYCEFGRDLWVLDLSGDLQIPVFAALSARTDAGPENIVFGFGAHFDPRIALFRALTELHQSVSALTGEGSSEVCCHLSESMQEWLKTVTRVGQPYLSPDPAQPRRRFADFPQGAGKDLRDDVHECVARAQSRGLETLVLDQTRPDVGMPVVRVVVPGLRHFWARLGPGRLYEVPVQMSWLSEPVAESQLNPTPIFV